MERSPAEVTAQLRTLGVRDGGVLLVHTSFRAVRPMAGGPLALVAALQSALGPRGTLVMPTMTDGETIFDPRTTPTADMGITAELFWRQPGVVRSSHPAGSFAAAGPHAEEICAPQPLSPPHGPDSPPGRVLACGGQVLLLGVTHGESTILHVAESLANVPYGISHPCVVAGPDGRPRTITIRETDHCCRGFVKMDAWLGDRLRRGVVGHADAVLGEARAIVDEATRRLRADPFAFLCPPAEDCEECAQARSSAQLP